MSKFLRGELLVFTNRGLIRLDEINKDDKILSIDKDNKYYYDEIDSITKVFKKKYKLNKIENYYFNNNIQVKAIKNIPYNYDLTKIHDYIYYDENNYLKNSFIGELSDFDFLGFPLNLSLNNDSNTNDNDFYRFQGLILTSYLRFNNEYDKSTIEFLDNYLKSQEIPYEIKKDNYSTTFDFSNQRKISINDIFKMSKDELTEFMNGIMENSNEFNITDNEIYKIIKFSCLLLGIGFTSYFKDGKTHIKILKEDKNKFIYNNYVWNKIKYIKKIDYTGNLYSLCLKSNNFYLTEFGFIS